MLFETKKQQHLFVKGIVRSFVRWIHLRKKIHTPVLFNWIVVAKNRAYSIECYSVSTTVFIH